MKKNVILVLMSFFMTYGFSQNMIIHKKSGEKIIVPVNEIEKITYNKSKTNNRLPVFVLTKRKYSEKESLESAVNKEFAGKYRIADWNDIKKYSNKAQQLVKELNLGEVHSVMITKNGQHFYGNTRHFFVSYHNHKKPSNYLAHDNINNYYLSLGSWYNLKQHVLCIRK